MQPIPLVKLYRSSSKSSAYEYEVGSALRKKPKPNPPEPSYTKGVEYWAAVEASIDGVLGGFGNGPLPKVDQLSSRLFILSLLPLLTFPNPLTPSPLPRPPPYRWTALDVGAGIGRVTANVLLPLFDDIVTTEPLPHFINEAKRLAQAGEGPWRHLGASKREEGRGKRVWFLEAGLGELDPSRPLETSSRSLGVVSSETIEPRDAPDFGEGANEILYDTIWCQWCLGHLSHTALLSFLSRCLSSLRSSTSYIIIKENVCDDIPGTPPLPTQVLDDEDSSLTRSDLKWQEIFKEVGVRVVKEEVQLGLPVGLFVVKTWVHVQGGVADG